MEKKLEKSKSQLELVLSEMGIHEKNRDYLKAQTSKKEAERLKNEISKLEKKDMKKKHKEDLSSIQAMHSEEMKAFSSRQEQELNQITTEGEQMKAQLMGKHKAEIKQFLKEFREEMSSEEYKPSGFVLVLDRKEKALAKLQNFMEAYEVQTEKKKLEQKQKQEWNQHKQQNLKALLKKITIRHESELEVLKQKISTKLSETEIQLQSEKQELLKKHHNILSQFTSAQKKQNLMATGKLKQSYASTKSGSSGLQRLKSANKLPSFLRQTKQIFNNVILEPTA